MAKIAMARSRSSQMSRECFCVINCHYRVIGEKASLALSQHKNQREKCQKHQYSRGNHPAHTGLGFVGFAIWVGAVVWHKGSLFQLHCLYSSRMNKAQYCGSLQRGKVVGDKRLELLTSSV